MSPISLYVARSRHLTGFAAKWPLIFAVCLFFPSIPLFASQMWGSAHGNTSSIHVLRLDLNTGAILSSASSGSGLMPAHMDDLASDPSRQRSVVWVIRDAPTANELFAVDPFREQLLSMVSIDSSEPIRTLAIDPISGLLYGTSASALHLIDPESGETTLIGATPMSVSHALGFDLSGNLYGIHNFNELVAIDKSTGATLPIATIDAYRINDIAASPEDGTMFGLGYGPPYSLYRIDLSTGELTTVGPSVFRSSGLAFTNVPEPSGAVIVMLVATSLIIRRNVFSGIGIGL